MSRLNLPPVQGDKGFDRADRIDERRIIAEALEKYAEGGGSFQMAAWAFAAEIHPDKEGT